MSQINLQDVIKISLLLVLLLLVGFIVLYIIRKRLSPSSQDFSNSSAFTLQDLRQMHRDGKITEEEFNLLKDKLLKETHL